MRIICDYCGERVSKKQANKSMHHTGRVLCADCYKLRQNNHDRKGKDN